MKFPLLEKIAEKNNNSNIGATIGAMSGITLSSVLSPKISSIFANKAVPLVEDAINSEEFFNQNVNDTMATFRNHYPAKDYPHITDELLRPKAEEKVHMMRTDAHNEFIHRRSNPYFTKAQEHMGRAGKKASILGLALGLSLPLAGTLLGKYIQDKTSAR